MLFRREHAGQGRLYALQRQGLPAQGQVDALVRGLHGGADTLLHILQIAKQPTRHQHAAQQQAYKQGPHLVRHGKILEIFQRHAISLIKRGSLSLPVDGYDMKHR